MKSNITFYNNNENKTIRDKLIEAAITIGGNDCLRAITSRSLSNTSGVNQFYIYKEFDSINEVMDCASDAITTYFQKLLTFHLQVFENNLFTYERSYKFFNSLLDDLLLTDVSVYSFFHKYYNRNYSLYSFGSELSKKNLKPIMDIIKTFLVDEIDVYLATVHLCESVVKYTLLIKNQKIEDNEESRKIIYDFIFSPIEKYLNFEFESNDKSTN